MVTPQQLRAFMISQFEITLFDNNNNHVSLFASIRGSIFRTSDTPLLQDNRTALAMIKQITPPYEKFSVSGDEWRELNATNKLKEFIENLL